MKKVPDYVLVAADCVDGYGVEGARLLIEELVRRQQVPVGTRLQLPAGDGIRCLELSIDYRVQNVRSAYSMEWSGLVPENPRVHADIALEYHDAVMRAFRSGQSLTLRADMLRVSVMIRDVEVSTYGWGEEGKKPFMKISGLAEWTQSDVEVERGSEEG